MPLTNQFSQKQTKKLKAILGVLQQVCDQKAEPCIQIMPPAKYMGITYMDNLDDIKDLPDDLLPEHIKSIGPKEYQWFYSTEMPFDFYSPKAMVMLQFHQTDLQDEDLLKDPEVNQCVVQMLTAISKNNISADQAKTYFPEDICKKIFRLNPPREEVLLQNCKAIEQLRRILVQQLATDHSADIQKERGFISFKRKHRKTAMCNLINQFLKDKYRVFFLAQKWGYIDNGARLLHYQKIRHIIRHQSEKMPDPLTTGRIPSEQDYNLWAFHRGYQYLDPIALYQNIQTAFPFITPETNVQLDSHEDSTVSVWAFNELDQIKQICAKYPRQNSMQQFLQTNFPDEISIKNVLIKDGNKAPTQENVTFFHDFAIQKDTITLVEDENVPLIFKSEFHKWQKNGNTTAHANEGHQQTTTVLAEDYPDIVDFAMELKAAHERKYNDFLKYGKPLMLNKSNTPQ